MHRFNVFFQFDGGDIEVSTVVEAEEKVEAISMAHKKITARGFDLTDIPAIAEQLE